MRLAERWTTTCLESHPECNHERPLSYPSRLLSIAANPIQIVITAGWIDRPLYATLSHSWGKNEFETLKSTNIEDLKHGIPNRMLPKTFSEAIQIARAVGIAYLWIDSLCIIQDNSKDWKVEASRMASVYGGSSLNIAASSARNGSEGCFVEPDHCGGGFTARVNIAGRGQVLDISNNKEVQKNVFDTHLATRAWAVQEKVLPPRTLHCGEQGLFWECRTRLASSFFPNGFSAQHVISCRQVLLLERNFHWHQWRELREWYSRCDLTRSEDKLIALSGMARSFQVANGDQYFAGLWRNSLEQGICWKALDPRQRPPYRAPSWSWAAIDGLVDSQFDGPRYHDTLHARVRSVSVVHPGGDNFGAVSHGTLSLHCDMIMCGTIAAKDIARANRKLCPVKHRLMTDDPDARALCFFTLDQTDHVLPFFLDCAEQKDSRLDQTVYYLPLRAGTFLHGCPPRDNEKDGRGVFGVVIEQTYKAADQYRRIGFFEYRAPGWWEDHDDYSECLLGKDYATFMEAVKTVISCESGGQIVNLV